MRRTHNIIFAERGYGEDIIKRYKSSGSRVSELAPVCFVGAEGGIRQSGCRLDLWWRSSFFN